MFTIKTNKPVAIDSPDHLMPFGCVLNNSTNPRFNQKLYNIYKHQISILDLGCAGGGFVYDCIKDGHIAIGIEGSDIPFWRRLFEWPKIPNNLFTADVTNPFTIYFNNKEYKFDCITSWEMMEHICEEDLPILFDNMKNHLKEEGIIVVSINVATQAHGEYTLSDGRPLYAKGSHHQNVQDINWWDNKINDFGLQNDFELLRYFDNDFVRGPGHGCDEFATEERMNRAILEGNAKEQWCTLNRVWKLL